MEDGLQEVPSPTEISRTPVLNPPTVFSMLQGQRPLGGPILEAVTRSPLCPPGYEVSGKDPGALRTGVSLTSVTF